LLRLLSVRKGLLLKINMKLTKEKLQKIIQEEYDSMYSHNTRDIADRILEDELDNVLEQIKSGMEKMMDSGDEDLLIDAYGDLKEVLKSILGK
jgi:hypothetical protein